MGPDFNEQINRERISFCRIDTEVAEGVEKLYRLYRVSHSVFWTGDFFSGVHPVAYRRG